MTANIAITLKLAKIGIGKLIADRWEIYFYIKFRFYIQGVPIEKNEFDDFENTIRAQNIWEGTYGDKYKTYVQWNGPTPPVEKVLNGLGRS
jgi:hypothetical protein